jgi:Flp pilus assembly protein TadG
MMRGQMRKGASRLDVCRLCRLGRERRSGAAVEFAIAGAALIAFLFGIVNLGLLGLTVGALQHAVEQTARMAAVTAAKNGGGDCPSIATIQGDFYHYAAPVIAANAATLTYGSGAVGASGDPWVDSSSPPGTYIALGAAYNWKPIGFPSFAGINLTIKTVAFAMGSPTC